MTTTKQKMEEMGFFFDEMQTGSSPLLKDKWHPEEKLMSTGEYLLTSDGRVLFDYADSDGAILEREDFPQ